MNEHGMNEPMSKTGTLTVNEHDGLAQLQSLPDLHLAVGPLEHADAEEEEDGGAVLDAIQHAVLGQVRSAVVVLRKAMQVAGKAWRSGQRSPAQHCVVWHDALTQIRKPRRSSSRTA